MTVQTWRESTFAETESSRFEFEWRTGSGRGLRSFRTGSSGWRQGLKGRGKMPWDSWSTRWHTAFGVHGGVRSQLGRSVVSNLRCLRNCTTLTISVDGMERLDEAAACAQWAARRLQTDSEAAITTRPSYSHPNGRGNPSPCVSASPNLIVSVSQTPLIPA